MQVNFSKKRLRCNGWLTVTGDGDGEKAGLRRKSMMSKAKVIKKMAAVLMAGAMMTALAVPVMAADPEPSQAPRQPVKKVTLTKVVDKYEYSYAPNTTFRFKVEPAAGDSDGTTLDGIEGGVTFADGADKIPFTPEMGVIGKTTVENSTDLTVNEAAFANEKPGIYRYVVSEVPPTAAESFEGVEYSREEIYFDVYKYSDGTFEYCFEDGDKNKVDGTITNTYHHGGKGHVNDLTISKKVSGNMRNESEDFDFEIEVTRSNSGEKFYVKTSTGKEITNWDGMKTKISLKHNESATIYGLSAGDTYTVKEVKANQNGYETKIDNVKTTTGVASGKISADKSVNYENHKETTSPTGIAMDIAPYAIMVAAAFVLGFAFLRIRHFGKNK